MTLGWLEWTIDFQIQYMLGAMQGRFLIKSILISFLGIWLQLRRYLSTQIWPGIYLGSWYKSLF